jgi:cell division septum initiation protein DivIVA
MLEQSRHQATELTNAARAEVEQTLEWARAQAAAILSRAQHGAEQLLAAAGLGEGEIRRVADAVVEAARQTTEASRSGPARPASAIAAPQTEDAPPVPAPTPAAPPVSPPSTTEAAAEGQERDESDEQQP